jgi:hypothetical protein
VLAHGLSVLTGIGLDHGGVDALWLRHSSAMRRAFLKRDRAIRADDAPGRCCTRREPCVEDKCELSSLAASCWVAILGVADADTEAGDAGVEHFDTLT